ncbi:MAG: hypothetical protein IKL28_05745 [Lachnospiraceae bacterium]|nr:hypothetical protein [Lachnospiraceae bacterium]
MKKQFRKVALAVIFSMMAAFLAPASQVALAATKTFTYAEQVSGDKVTTLFMDKGEKVDLKFMGVSNWKTYKYKWVSSNTKVAVVDSAGVITAMGNGIATIKLTISGGDGTKYESTGVTVYVGQEQTVTIGTAATDEIKSYTVAMGKSVILKANGIKDDVGDRYIFNWSSTDTSVAKVSNNGVITTVAPGLTVIQLSVTKKSSGAVMQATPIAVLVTGGTACTHSYTSKITKQPTTSAAGERTYTCSLCNHTYTEAIAKLTVTPAPTTPTPGNPNVTTAPSASNENYTVSVTSDRSVTVTFKNKVTYTAKDVEFSQMFNDDVPLKLDLESVVLDSTGKVMTITTRDTLSNDNYNVKIGTTDKGLTFPVRIGAPDRMEITYSCLGKDGVAYVYDEEMGLDVPVTLTYKLFSNNVDVTETYGDAGYISYELISPTSSDYVTMSGEQLFFYSSRVTAAVQAIYTYYTESGAEKELPASVSIKAQALGNYNITRVAKWTIIDDEKTTKIDWDNPVKSVVAGSYGHKIVALLQDSYGYYYSTDERGVDRENNIFSVEDSDTLFAMKGYSCSMSASNDTNYFIDASGFLQTYAADSRAAVILTLHNYDAWSSGEKKLEAWTFTILAESKLNSIQPEQTSVTLLTQAANNEDRFCSVDIPIKLIDQYKEEWKGEPSLEVTSSSSLLNNNIDSVAYVKELNGKWVLHVDGKEIKDAGVSSSATFYITDSLTNKKSTGIRVALKNPANANGEIALGTWEVGMVESNISYGEGGEADISAQAEIEIYQLSKNGSYKVGLLTNGSMDEQDNLVNVILQPTATYTFPASDVREGDVYVLVLGPDNRIVDEAGDNLNLGVYLDGAGKVKVNITESSSNLKALAAGRYTVKVTKINKITNSYVSKTTKTTTFTVEDKTKDVAVVGYNNNRRTSESVYGIDDDKMKDIVCELFVFTLGGTKWTTLTRDMITKVNCSVVNSNGAYRINSVEFAVPVGDDGNVTYSKTVKINQTIYTDVN